MWRFWLYAKSHSHSGKFKSKQIKNRTLERVFLGFKENSASRFKSFPEGLGQRTIYRPKRKRENKTNNEHPLLPISIPDKSSLNSAVAENIVSE